MKSQAIVAHGAPLEEIIADTPEPLGTEVLLSVTHCGVCHSDVHLHDGHFDMGGGKQLDVTASHTLPHTLGHEIEGSVAALGPQADGVAVGERRVVYPWIGCGECAVCSAGDEQLCNRPRALGINLAGGFSDHVLVPHPRYLLDCSGVAEGLAATCMCSGLTAFSALGKLVMPTPPQSIAVVGLGGVGMMGLQLARTLFAEARLLAVDVDEGKLETAVASGADAVYDARSDGAVKQLVKDTGGAAAAVDFVGSEASLEFASRAVRKGGRVVIVGLFGGRFSMPIPMFPLRALSLIGSYVGTLAEARQLLDLVRAGRVAPIPIERRPLAQAGRSLDDLRGGRVLGRIVLSCQG